MDDQAILQHYERSFEALVEKHKLARQKLEEAGWKAPSAEFEEVEESARAFARSAAAMQ